MPANNVATCRCIRSLSAFALEATRPRSLARSSTSTTINATTAQAPTARSPSAPRTEAARVHLAARARLTARAPLAVRARLAACALRIARSRPGIPVLRTREQEAPTSCKCRQSSPTATTPPSHVEAPSSAQTHCGLSSTRALSRQAVSARPSHTTRRYADRDLRWRRRRVANTHRPLSAAIYAKPASRCLLNFSSDVSHHESPATTRRASGGSLARSRRSPVPAGQYNHSRG